MSQTTKGIFHILDAEGNIICMTTDEEKANYISHALNVYFNLRAVYSVDYIQTNYETDVTVVKQREEN